MLPTTKLEGLPSVLDILTDREILFIIPTFQRPYAWEDKQLKDLQSDLGKAALKAAASNPRRPPQHYFAQAHVAAINSAVWDRARKDNSDPIGQFLDWNNSDLKITAEVFKRSAESGSSCPIRPAYAVVDGQQRLITLYLLSLLKTVLNPSPTSTRRSKDFMLPLPSPNPELPRILLNPNDDHRFFRQIVDFLVNHCPQGATVAFVQGSIKDFHPTSPAQERLLNMALDLATFAVEPETDALESSEIKLGLTELDINFALTSFITLNDRGKDLTTLEKLKALWLETALQTGAVASAPDIHNIFGNLYRLADQCTKAGLVAKTKDAEDLLVQLLYHWVDMTAPRHENWYSADNAYQWFSERATNATATTVADWLKAAQELYDQLDHLCVDYLIPELRPAAGPPSLHFPKSALALDYQAVLVSLRLPHHFLALFLKFRAICGREWHEQFQIKVPCDPMLIRPIRILLKELRERADADLVSTDVLKGIFKRAEALVPAIPDLENGGEELEKTCVAETSMLEAIERMTLLGWLQNSNPKAGFITRCNATFAHADPASFIELWYVFCNASGFYDRWYIERLCQRDAPQREDYLLKEWERHLGGNLYSARANLELEHVLAEAWNPVSWRTWGFKGEKDFRDTTLQRIGNKMLLWEPCNRSVGKDDPNLKATHYSGKTCPGHAPSGVSAQEILMVREVGKDLAAIGTPSSAYRIYIEARCAELAAFALSRFFAHCTTPCA